MLTYFLTLCDHRSMVLSLFKPALTNCRVWLPKPQNPDDFLWTQVHVILRECLVAWQQPSGPDCEWFESASGMLLFEHCRVILCSKWLLLKNAAVHTAFDQWEELYISHWVRSRFSFKRHKVNEWSHPNHKHTFSHIPDCKILLTGL